MSEELATRLAGCRGIARELRRMAEAQRFDLCRRDQLIALAQGFERLAERLAREPEQLAAAD